MKKQPITINIEHLVKEIKVECAPGSKFTQDQLDLVQKNVSDGILFAIGTADNTLKNRAIDQWDLGARFTKMSLLIIMIVNVIMIICFLLSLSKQNNKAGNGGNDTSHSPQHGNNPIEKVVSPLSCNFYEHIISFPTNIPGIVNKTAIPQVMKSIVNLGVRRHFFRAIKVVYHCFMVDFAQMKQDFKPSVMRLNSPLI